FHQATSLEFWYDKLREILDVLVFHGVGQVEPSDPGFLDPAFEFIGDGLWPSNDRGRGATDTDVFRNVTWCPLLVRIHLRKDINHRLARIGIDMGKRHIRVEG